MKYIDSVDTKLGKIEVHRSNWSKEGYPGYTLMLAKDSSTYLGALDFEVDEHDPVCMKIRMYDSEHDYPIFSFRGELTEKGLAFEQF